MRFFFNLKKLFINASGILLFIAAWQFVSGFYTPEQWPRPLDVANALIELYNSGMLREHVQTSLLRFIMAYSLAVICGLPTGILIGRCKIIFDALNPLIQIIRPISPIAWFPLAVLWFGIGNSPAVFIIFLSAFFPILLSTVTAVSEVPENYLKVSRNFGAPKLMIIFKVIFPAAFPTIVIGLRIAVGTAWIHLVAGEMLGAQSGLGFLIVDARNFLRTDLIIAAMLIVGAIGLLIDFIMKTSENLFRKNRGL